MSELYDILVETPPTKVILLALDQGLWDCERSLAELAALCEANHMEAVAEVLRVAGDEPSVGNKCHNTSPLEKILEI